MKHLLFVLMLIIIAGPALAAANESSSSQPTAVISPYTYWPSTPTSGRFYRPTGIRVGNELFLYVQGGAYINVATGPGSEACGCNTNPTTCKRSGEQALLFKAPFTAVGLKSNFTFVRTISPCEPNKEGVHYQTGSVFRSSTDNKIKLLIDQTEGGANPTSGHFKRVLLGSSSDGVQFSWTTFLKQSVVGGVTYSINDVVMVQATANSNWWGVFQWAQCTRCDGTDGSGFVRQGRIRVTMDPTNVRGFYVEILAGSATTWARVNDDGSFNFVPFNTQGPDVKSIIYTNFNNNPTWEAWAKTAGTAVGGCEDEPGVANPKTTASFSYYPVMQGLHTTPQLQPVTSSVRAMPSRNGTGLVHPFRIQGLNAANLLYSTSTERICLAGQQEAFRGAEIIYTELSYSP